MDLRERTGSGARHPWEVARLEHVLALLRRYGTARPLAVLDAGAGDSFVAAKVAAQLPGCRVTCWDPHYSDDDLALSPAGTLRVRDAPSETFDVILALDVIEHVEDDAAFLRGVRANAHPDSTLIVTVPAHQRLFSTHDVYLGHHRRYSGRSLAGVVTDSGWQPVASGGFFASLLPVRAASVWLERRRAGGRAAAPTFDEPVAPAGEHLGTWSRGPAATRLVKAVLASDAAVARRVAGVGRSFPGLSLFLVARPTPRPEQT